MTQEPNSGWRDGDGGEVGLDTCGTDTDHGNGDLSRVIPERAIGFNGKEGDYEVGVLAEAGSFQVRARDE